MFMYRNDANFNEFVLLFSFFNIVGPRYCIGKYMAEIFLYTFVANVLQHFEVTTDTDGELSFSNKFNKFGLTPEHFDEIVLKSV